jgi:hypothetical protein
MGKTRIGRGLVIPIGMLSLACVSVNAQQKCHVVALSRNVMEKLEMKGSRSERSERRLAFEKVELWLQ